jgi:hypothetical protein
MHVHVDRERVPQHRGHGEVLAMGTEEGRSKAVSQIDATFAEKTIQR